MELAALERLKIDVTSFSWLLLIGCLFNLHVMMTGTISWICLNLNQIGQRVEAALGHLKFIMALR